MGIAPSLLQPIFEGEHSGFPLVEGTGGTCKFGPSPSPPPPSPTKVLALPVVTSPTWNFVPHIFSRWLFQASFFLEEKNWFQSFGSTFLAILLKMAPLYKPARWISIMRRHWVIASIPFFTRCHESRVKKQ